DRVIPLLLALSAILAGCGGLLPQGVELIEGPVNGLRVRVGAKTAAIYGDSRESPPPADAVLFTHHRRDVVWAGRALARSGAETIGPEAERRLFEQTDAFWREYAA